MKKVALITGGSSGIGLKTAQALCASGCRVYELSRRDITHQDGVVHLTGDVTLEASVLSAVEQILEKEGRIDLLICNAGFGISGAAEFTENQDAERLLDVNFFGVVNAVKAVIPAMRRQGGGRILCVSSVAGAIPIPFQAWYSASKAAVNAYAEAIREELRPFGIEVCTVLPGDTRTGFTDAREKSQLGDDVYQGRISRSVAGMEKDERTGISAEKAGEYIQRIALKKRVKPIYVIGGFYRLAVLLARILPGSVRSRIVGMLYAS